MKNHVQWIKSEAEYLAKTYPETEIQDSTGCILDACQMCFASIENANKLMGVQKLDMPWRPWRGKREEGSESP